MEGDPLEWFRWFYDAQLSEPGAMEERWHEDLVIVQATEMIDSAGTFEAYEGLAAVNAEIEEAYTDFEWRPEAVHELGDDRYLVELSVMATGRASGIPLEVQLSHLVTLRGDKACRLEAYMGWEAGRSAAGLDGSEDA